LLLSAFQDLAERRKHPVNVFDPNTLQYVVNFFQQILHFSPRE
jgi:hypothetical protein